MDEETAERRHQELIAAVKRVEMESIATGDAIKSSRLEKMVRRAVWNGIVIGWVVVLVLSSCVGGTLMVVYSGWVQQNQNGP